MFSDLHVDFEYTPGNSNNCGKTLCCRKDSGAPKSPEETAGKWGDYQCDLAPNTMMNMFDFFKDVIKPDLALWGGDSISHNIESITYK